jgi:RND family efflux transporter MFP subunit
MATMLAACGRGNQPPAQVEAERPAQSVTHWTEKTEVFAEHPVLVAGQTALFAVHLTKLDDFQAVNAGRASIELYADDGSVTTLAGTGPLRPGVFRVEGQVPPPGRYTWALLVEAPALSDRHDLGTITVYPDEQAAETAAAPAGEVPTVTYLKEQQWTNEFATVIVQTSALRVAVRAPATVEPLAGGEAIVGAPASGRLVPGPLPELGARVSSGQVLARFEPRLTGVEDRATLVQQLAEARAALEAAEAERDRAARLLAERAVPARRVEEARRGFAVAQAQVQAAETRLQQRDQTLSAGGGGAGGNTFVLRSPIAGRVVSINATPGATFDEGAELFRIVRTDRVVVHAHVGAADAAQVRAIAGAELEVPGETDPIRLVVRGVRDSGVIDADSRALSVHLETDNPNGRLLVGQAGTAVLYMQRRAALPAIPRSAVLTEGGRPVVFIQVAGESFEKRPIETGPRDGDLVGVRSGLRRGERVVSRGAYEVLLASASKGLPAEGHVH